MIWNEPGSAKYIAEILGFLNLVPIITQLNLTWNVYILIFYLIFGFIFATFFLIAYIGYIGTVYADKKNKGNFVVFILRIILTVLTTVLYQPFIIYLLSLSSCFHNSQNLYVHYLFPDMQCWTGSHIMHGCFSFLALALFILISFFTTLILYENRLNFSNPAAKFYNFFF